jgi:recombination protein RecA
MTENKKNVALKRAVDQIEKKYGKGTIMKLGDDRYRQKVKVIPTGALTLDMALGVGGIPTGRVVEIFGPEASGKTTLSLELVANAQAQGGNAAYIDVEHALDPVYAKKIGVDIDNLLISQPDFAEQALEVVETLVRSGAVDIIVVDSVAALVPKTELEGEMGDTHIGLQARLMSQALRKLTATIAKSTTTTIFVNQIRMKIGVMFGSPETTPGGRALKFYSSIRLDIRRIGSIKSGLENIGNRISVKVAKNKVAPPFRKAEFDIIYGEGISREGCLIDVAINEKILEKSGTWYSYKNKQLGQGKINTISYFKNNPKLSSEIESKIRQRIFSPEKENTSE